VDPGMFQKGPSQESGDVGPPVGSRGKAPAGGLGTKSPETKADVKYLYNC